jgi:hypothetical protein
MTDLMINPNQLPFIVDADELVLPAGNTIVFPDGSATTVKKLPTEGGMTRAELAQLIVERFGMHPPDGPGDVKVTGLYSTDSTTWKVGYDT